MWRFELGDDCSSKVVTLAKKDGKLSKELASPPGYQAGFVGWGWVPDGSLVY